MLHLKTLSKIFQTVPREKRVRQKNMSFRHYSVPNRALRKALVVLDELPDQQSGMSEPQASLPFAGQESLEQLCLVE